MENHFKNAKDLLVRATNLSIPDPEAPIALRTDASNHAIAGCLEQLVQGAWQPLGFWSRHLKPSESSGQLSAESCMRSNKPYATSCQK